MEETYKEKIEELEKDKKDLEGNIVELKEEIEGLQSILKEINYLSR